MTSVPVLVIHGGAGTIARAGMTTEREQAYRRALSDALEAGRAILTAGGTSLDAVVAAVASMEDCPLFNAGKGAAFTSEGRNELDASVMDGRTLAAGGVAGVTRIKNPIVAARAVMLRSGHVLLAGQGAEAFATEQGLELVDPSYFYTEERWQQLERAKRKASTTQEAPRAVASTAVEPDALDAPTRFGTVGAVALDTHGNLAAATSTGGLANKRYGRVGDSPIIGAGTYADNRSAAISATGTGETFIRAVAAYEVTALMRYKGLSLAQAVDEVALRTVPALGGSGGLIGVDVAGNVAMSFSTEGMYRGVVRGDGAPEVAIYR
jgi:beta-aspartyl-peptidase (threonine type)